MPKPLYIARSIYHDMARDYALSLNPLAGEYEINQARIEISENYNIWPVNILPDVILNGG
jgi:hypothetical protein